MINAGRASCASIGYYDSAADRLVERYESLPFEAVHRAVLDLIPEKGYALDIGAGSGRDAAALAARGLCVTAVEPCSRLLTSAKRIHGSTNVRWLTESLPSLSHLESNRPYDLILASAVWMHVAPQDARQAAERLAALARPHGVVILTLRSPLPNVPGVFQHEPEDVIALMSACGLKMIRRSETQDSLGREAVFWTALCFSGDRHPIGC